MGQKGRSWLGILTMMICLAGAVPVVAGTWTIQIVDSAGDVGYGPSLAYDPVDRNPSIAYRENVGGSPGTRTSNAKFAHWNGTSWVTEVIGPMNLGSVQLAYNQVTGQPCVAYTAMIAKGKYSMVLATRSAPGVWTKEVVDSEVPNALALALDQTNVPGIAYIKTGKTTSTVYYTRKTGTTWPKQTVASGAFENVSLAYDQANNPAIAYNPHDTVEFCVKLKVRVNESTWPTTPETVECGSRELGPWGFGTFPSLAYSPATNQPSIVTSGGGSAAWPRYSIKAGSWTTETIDPTAPDAYWFSLRFTGAGVPYVGYVSAGSVTDEIRVAHLDGAAWVIETVEAGQLYYRSSLALDSAGLPSVAYQDATALDLKFARYTP